MTQFAVYFRIRGRLLTVSTLNENIGLIAGFFGAFYGDKLAVIVTVAILSFMFLGYLLFLHESPFFYYKSGRPGEAEASLRYYWNVKEYSNFTDDNEYTDYKDNLRRKWDNGAYQYSIAGPSSGFTRGEGFLFVFIIFIFCIFFYVFVLILVLECVNNRSLIRFYVDLCLFL